MRRNVRRSRLQRATSRRNIVKAREMKKIYGATYRELRKSRERGW